MELPQTVQREQVVHSDIQVRFDNEILLDDLRNLPLFQASGRVIRGAVLGYRRRIECLVTGEHNCARKNCDLGVNIPDQPSNRLRYRHTWIFVPMSAVASLQLR